MIPSIPPLDPMPIPAPLWLLKGLLWVTFSIHLVFMNLTLGGALLAAVYAFRGKDRDRSVSKSLAKMLPYVMPFTITFGIAPLLFVQVLYGPLFYSSTILMATPFLAVIGVLLAAYYGMYILARKWTNYGVWQGLLATAILLLVGYVGFMNANVYSMMLSPEKFHDAYLASPGGFQLNLSEPTLIPRLLHVFFAAVAVAGLCMAYLGTRRLKLEPEAGRWQVKSGATWFAAATIVNLGVGAWYLMAIPREGLLLFMGGSALATGAFIVGLVSGVSALVLALVGVNSLKPLPLLMGSIHALTLTIVCMVIMRDTLRDALLKPVFDVYAQPTAPQWGAISLFLVLFLLGVGACVWLLRVARAAAKEKASRGENINRGPGLTDSGLHKFSAEDSQAMRGGSSGDLFPRNPT